MDWPLTLLMGSPRRPPHYDVPPQEETRNGARWFSRGFALRASRFAGFRASRFAGFRGRENPRTSLISSNNMLHEVQLVQASRVFALRGFSRPRKTAKTREARSAKTRENTRAPFRVSSSAEESERRGCTIFKKISLCTESNSNK